MTQRETNHPYMSKNQLNDYLASLRNEKQDSQRALPRTPVHRESEDRGSTPLVRALRERYGSGNTPAGYVDVAVSKRGDSPTKRALPPLPGAKTENSTVWKANRRSGSGERRSEETRDEYSKLPERSASPPKKQDFWSTGVAPSIYASSSASRGQRPLPPDPRDELRMPPIDDLSINDSKTTPPSINVPSINLSSPAPTIPSINVPSISVPSDSSSSTRIPEVPPKAERSWPNVHVRSKGSAALLCAICSKPIAGRIVTAVGSRFHPECFRCNTCSTELEHVAFYENDGKVYCHLDYHELFSPRCKHCSTPIENEVISALGNKYHPGHFFCAGCGDPFGATTPFIVRDKYPWCERCYENKYAPKCAKCRKPVLDEVLNAMGKTWHPSGCFVCKECGSDFGDDGFFIDTTDNKPMCKACKHVRLLKQVGKIRA